MDIQNACETLEISWPFSLHDLKKKYYRQALRWHPDKNNNSEESKKRFQEINASYEILTKHLEIDKPPEKLWDYSTLLKSFLETFTSFNPKIVEILKTGCEETILKLLNEIDGNVLSHLYGYLSTNSTFLHIGPELLAKLECLIREKTENYMIVHPSLDNLFNDDVYPVTRSNPDGSDEIYYVPLWHDILIYPLKETKHELTIKCSPHLPDHVSIDEDNNLHVNLTTKIIDILSKQQLSFTLGNKVFEILSKDISIKKNQIITLDGRGISKINQTDIFNVNNRSNIIVYLNLL